MADTATTRAEAARLFAFFQAQGAQAVEADLLQPSEVLLDLYGEDIRARAYVTVDPVDGEQMLRPDFTVPVVQAHMKDGAEPARYTYSGKVFRKQEAGTGRAREYSQVGYEVFDRANPAAADAEVFGLVAQALDGVAVRAVCGDVGILTAAVAGLTTSEARRAALMRHIWRPKRFRALLDRFAGVGGLPVGRAEIMARGAVDGVEIGLRSRGEVEARLALLRDEASVEPISRGEYEAIGAILEVSDGARAALVALRRIAEGFAPIDEAVERFSARLEALDARGVDVDTLTFKGAFGRATMEYYDGFVFEFSGDTDMPPVASGGRYDALTRVLGQGREIPAVGAVIRPELLTEMAR